MEGVGELSSKKVYSQAGNQEILDFDLLIIPAAWDDNNNVLHNGKFLGFRVGVSEGGRKTSRKATQKSKLAQKRAAAAAQAKAAAAAAANNNQGGRAPG